MNCFADIEERAAVVRVGALAIESAKRTAREIAESLDFGHDAMRSDAPAEDRNVKVERVSVRREADRRSPRSHKTTARTWDGR